LEITSGSYLGMKTSQRGFKIPDQMPFLETKENDAYSSTSIGHGVLLKTIAKLKLKNSMYKQSPKGSCEIDLEKPPIKGTA